jgi:arabinogalactan endo-1,4-beta-galactosidase
MTRSRVLLALAAALVLLARPAAAAPRLVTGADVSSLPQVEAGEGVFRSGPDTVDVLLALRDAGVSAVRLRVWHTPAGGECGVDATVATARRARALGLRLMLDPHYSDTWADPGHQAPPAAWRGLGLPALADSVRAWTRGLVAACAVAGAAPEWVQLGNEVDGGLLWETGRLGARDSGWVECATLLRAAAEGAAEGAPGVRRVVHFSRGGSLAAATWFFDQLERFGVPYEVAGLSWYPWWHGPLDALRGTLAAVAARTGREVMVVETAYPWTLQAVDDTRNVVGERGQVSAWPATPEGQAAFAHDVRAAVRGVPEARGTGVWWWEPAWIAAPRAGSPWENCALFDTTGNALPALRAFAH